MNQDVYNYWLGVASRLSGNEEDARDLLHDALEVAVEQGRIAISREDNAGWFFGVLRNLKALKARGTIRRKVRERKVVDESELSKQTDWVNPGSDEIAATVSALVSGLTPAVRVVVLLQLHGLAGPEILSVLGISSAAYRKRLQSAREHFRLLPPSTRSEIVDASRVKQVARAETFNLGLIREALLNKMSVKTGQQRELGTHDPDGHLLVFGIAKKKR